MATVAKVAVQAATYAIDKVYDYLLPPELAGQVGCRVLVPFALKQTASRFFRPIARIRVDVPLAFRQRAGQLFLPIVAGIRVLVHRMLLQRADKNAVAVVALLVMLVDVAIPVAAAEFALRIIAIGGMVMRLKAASHNIGKDCLRLALGNQAGQLVHIAVRRVGMLLQPAVPGIIST